MSDKPTAGVVGRAPGRSLGRRACAYLLSVLAFGCLGQVALCVKWRLLAWLLMLPGTVAGEALARCVPYPGYWIARNGLGHFLYFALVFLPVLLNRRHSVVGGFGLAVLIHAVSNVLTIVLILIVLSQFHMD